MKGTVKKVSTVGKDEVQVVVIVKKQTLTVDILEYVGKKLELRVPEEPK